MAEACEQLRKELSATESAKLRSHTLDITDTKTCAALAQFLKKEHGGLDVLVNNAGIAFKVDEDFKVGRGWGILRRNRTVMFLCRMPTRHHSLNKRA